jgi:hypothetical protein
VRLEMGFAALSPASLGLLLAADVYCTLRVRLMELWAAVIVSVAVTTTV